MSVNRPSRGVLLPSFRQLLAILVVGSAAYWLWVNYPGNSDPPPRPEARSLAHDLQTIEDLAARGPEAVPELVALLSSDERGTRRLALYGLGLLGERAAPALDAVRERLVGEDAEFRGYAFSAFVQICRDPEDLWATAARMLADPDARIRDTAARILDGTNVNTIVYRPPPSPGNASPVDRTVIQNVVRNVLPLAGAELPETRSLVIKIACWRDRSNDDPEITRMLRRLLDDPDRAVRGDAIVAFAARDAAPVDQVREWLRNDDPTVVTAGLGAVYWLGAERIETLPDLLDLVDKAPDQNLVALINALQLLKTESKPAVPGLLRRLDALEIRVSSGGGAGQESTGRSTAMEISRRFEAVPALLEMGAEPADLLPYLNPFLAPTHPNFGRKAAEMLARFRPDDAHRLAARLVQDIEQEENPAITTKALEELCGLGPAASDAVPALIRLIERNDPKRIGFVYYSIEALGCIGPTAAPAVPGLIARLDLANADGDASTRHAIIVQSLGKMGPAAQSAVPAFLAILDRPPPPQRDPAEATSRTKDYQPPCREVNTALGLIGDNSEPVLARLRRQLAMPGDPQRRFTALKTLILLSGNTESLLPDLVRSLVDEDAGVRLLAAQAVAANDDRRHAVASLAQALKDSDPRVASAAALALRDLGPAAEPATPTLREIAGEGRNKIPNGIRVRRNSAPSLSNMTVDHDLARLSLAEAALAALRAIEPSAQ